MTPQEQRNEQLAQTIIKNLKRRHIEGFYCATPEEGVRKVAQNVEAALARARSTASPINAARFDIKTPCHTDGVCHNCNSPQSICNYIHFLRNSPQGRHTVVLVGENLGY